MSLDLALIRSQFPALQQATFYFDNASGTQVARPCLERMNQFLVGASANPGETPHGGRAADGTIANARRAMADFFNARAPEEIIFGANMTSLTFQISRSVGELLRPGDAVVVTRLDNDANIDPWVRMAEERGCPLRWVDIRDEDCTLDLADYKAALQDRPRLVAFGYASNAVGTINPVEKMTALAHAAGALVYVDAVQFASHGPIDVQQLGCDFLVCSAHRCFGPHLGILYGRRELLEMLPASRVRSAPATAPRKFETGAANSEGLAGLLGALDYIEWLGYLFGEDYRELYAERYGGGRLIFKQAMSAIRSYEYGLNQELLEMLQEIPGVTLYGIQEPDRLEERVPTVAFTLAGRNSTEVAVSLGEQGIRVCAGNFNASATIERLKLEGAGGLVRIGATHYNTKKEIERLGEALTHLARDRSAGGI